MTGPSLLFAGDKGCQKRSLDVLFLVGQLSLLSSSLDLLEEDLSIASRCQGSCFTQHRRAPCQSSARSSTAFEHPVRLPLEPQELLSVANLQLSLPFSSSSCLLSLRRCRRDRWRTVLSGQRCLARQLLQLFRYVLVRQRRLDGESPFPPFQPSSPCLHSDSGERLNCRAASFLLEDLPHQSDRRSHVVECDRACEME